MKSLLPISIILALFSGCAGNSGAIPSGETAPLTIRLPPEPGSRGITGSGARALTTYYEVYISEEYNQTVVASGRPGEVITVEVPTGSWSVVVLAGTPDSDGYSLLGTGRDHVSVQYGAVNEVTVRIVPVIFELYDEGQVQNGHDPFTGRVSLGTSIMGFLPGDFTLDEYPDTLNLEVEERTSNGYAYAVSFSGTTLGGLRLGPVPLLQDFLPLEDPVTGFGELASAWYLGCASDRPHDALWAAMTEPTLADTAASVSVTIAWNE